MCSSDLATSHSHLDRTLYLTNLETDLPTNIPTQGQKQMWTRLLNTINRRCTSPNGYLLLAYELGEGGSMLGTFSDWKKLTTLARKVLLSSLN